MQVTTPGMGKSYTCAIAIVGQVAKQLVLAMMGGDAVWLGR